VGWRFAVLAWQFRGRLVYSNRCLGGRLLVFVLCPRWLWRRHVAPPMRRHLPLARVGQRPGPTTGQALVLTEPELTALVLQLTALVLTATRPRVAVRGLRVAMVQPTRRTAEAAPLEAARLARVPRVLAPGSTSLDPGAPKSCKRRRATPLA